MIYHREKGAIESTYLALDVAAIALILAVRADGSWATLARSKTTTLGQILLTFLPSNLDLLLFAAAAEFVRLEGTLGLEGRTTMFGDVAIGHGDNPTGLVEEG
jgi:hypothetical protein